MLYADYDTKFDEVKLNNKSGTSSLIDKIKRHKLITMVTMTFVVLSTLNFVMIYNFMQILKNV